MTPPDEPRGELMRPVNDPTTFALDLVRSEMGRRFDDLSRQLGEMVTRKEHEAVVARLDADAVRLREDLATHEREAEERHDRLAKDVKDADSQVLAEIKEDRAQRITDAAKAAEARKIDRRWTIGAVLTSVGLAVPIAAFIRDLLGP